MQRAESSAVVYDLFRLNSAMQIARREFSPHDATLFHDIIMGKMHSPFSRLVVPRDDDVELIQTRRFLSLVSFAEFFAEAAQSD